MTKKNLVKLENLVVDLDIKNMRFFRDRKVLSSKLAFPLTTTQELALESYTLLFFPDARLDNIAIETDILEQMTIAQYGGLDLEESKNNLFSWKNISELLTIGFTGVGLSFVPKIFEFFARQYKEAKGDVSKGNNSVITAAWLEDQKVGSYQISSAIYKQNSRELKIALKNFKKATGIDLMLENELLNYLGKSEDKKRLLQKSPVIYLERQINMPESHVKKILDKEPNPRASKSAYKVPTLVSRTNLDIEKVISNNSHEKQYVVSITVVNGQSFVNRCEYNGPKYG